MLEKAKTSIEASNTTHDDIILSVKNLTMNYTTRETGVCEAVRDVSFDIRSGETLGLVGETGAGKTSIALSILRLLSMPPANITNGEIMWQGRDILRVSDREMRKIRGGEISMVFQDPMTALNPIDTIGTQIAEVIYLHRKVNKAEAKKLAGDILEIVGIQRDRSEEYPHQFSGGMKQRVVIAMALACNPKLLIADEPTTALDVTIQAQVLKMMNDLKEKNGTALLPITHDLGVIAEMCQRVAVIYAGEIVEIGTAEAVFDHTAHPYTLGLFGSLPSVASSKRLSPIPGMMPDPANLPKGCKFAERCKYATKECVAAEIPLVQVRSEHFCRCVHPQAKED